MMMIEKLEGRMPLNAIAVEFGQLISTISDILKDKGAHQSSGPWNNKSPDEHHNE